MSEERASAPAKLPASFCSVVDLRPDTSGHNLVVKVLDAKTVLDRPARAGQKSQKVAECTVGDETGLILLSARNEHVELVQPGSYITVRNARIEMFRSSMRLLVDKFGKIEPAASASFEPKEDLNMSLIEYELVSVPSDAMVPKTAKKPAEQAAEEPVAEGRPTSEAVEEAVRPAPAAAEATVEEQEQEAAMAMEPAPQEPAASVEPPAAEESAAAAAAETPAEAKAAAESEPMAS